MDNNFNFDENTMNKLNSMMQNGDVSKIMSNISPEMIENFSKMINNTENTSNDSRVNSSSNSSYSNNSNTSTNYSSNPNVSTNTSNNSNNINNFDFSNIDINTIMKMKNIMQKMNSTNDPRSNLLASLKPYLRDNKKEKLDQYANLMNFAKIAELLKSENSNNKEK